MELFLENTFSLNDGVDGEAVSVNWKNWRITKILLTIANVFAMPFIIKLIWTSLNGSLLFWFGMWLFTISIIMLKTLFYPKIQQIHTVLATVHNAMEWQMINTLAPSKIWMFGMFLQMVVVPSIKDQYTQLRAAQLFGGLTCDTLIAAFTIYNVLTKTNHTFVALSLVVHWIYVLIALVKLDNFWTPETRRVMGLILNVIIFIITYFSL